MIQELSPPSTLPFRSSPSAPESQDSSLLQAIKIEDPQLDFYTIHKREAVGYDASM